KKYQYILVKPENYSGFNFQQHSTLIECCNLYVSKKKEVETMIKNKDFNILFSGRLLANFGDSLYGIATMLLVYQLTNSSFYSGVALCLTSSVGLVQIFISPIFNKINIKKMLI